jgi:DeoR/GlpR family transcriptional regulator of sugar metabolism
MMEAGLITRVHGGAKLAKDGRDAAMSAAELHNAPLTGVPFQENINRNRLQKKAIGMAAAGLYVENEGVMIDGGSTTFQMCPHLNGMNRQVLASSLHIVNTLLSRAGKSFANRRVRSRCFRRLPLSWSSTRYSARLLRKSGRCYFRDHNVHLPLLLLRVQQT